MQTHRPDVDPTRILTRRELAAVLADLKRKAPRSKNTRLNLAIFRLAACCGLRVTEIAKLRLSDVRVDLERPHLRIRNGASKGGRPRIVPLWWDAGTLGRLVLNVLLSFAQFEREIIGERIRDKIAAQRRKGKWTGGFPVLGYDVDRSGGSPKLVVNDDEARRVHEIFELYLSLGSMPPVVEELERRGWLNKQWTTKKGTSKGGARGWPHGS